jgi:uncharacterized protein
MEKRSWILFVLSVIVIGMFFLGFFGNVFVNGWDLESDDDDYVCINNKCVDVEVVSDVESRTKGLMFREELCDGCGMLFVFDDLGLYDFWMKNTLIPLDIIWINENYRVVDIKNAVPCLVDESYGKCVSYGGDYLAKYVLEVNSGFVEENKIEVGDEVLFRIR